MVYTKKYCLVDGIEIQKKKHESVNRYGGKKFCSQVCAKKYMKENKIGWFNPSLSRVKVSTEDMPYSPFTKQSYENNTAETPNH